MLASHPVKQPCQLQQPLLKEAILNYLKGAESWKKPPPCTFAPSVSPHAFVPLAPHPLTFTGAPSSDQCPSDPRPPIPFASPCTLP